LLARWGGGWGNDEARWGKRKKMRRRKRGGGRERDDDVAFLTATVRPRCDFSWVPVVSGILVGVFVVNLVETAAVVQWRSKSGSTFLFFLVLVVY
jgi:hypothetical protein